MSRQTILSTRLSPVYVNETAKRQAVVFGTELSETIPQVLSLSIGETASAADLFVSSVDYVVSITETATASDSFSGTADEVTSISDAVVTSDSAVSVVDYAASIVEPANRPRQAVLSTRLSPVYVNETAKRQTVAFGTGLNESVPQAVDYYNSRVDYLAALIESANANDSTKVEVDYLISASEAASATDNWDGRADYIVSLTESASADDSAIGGLDFSASVAETTTATDTLVSTADYAAFANEPAICNDNLTVIVSYVVSVADAANAADIDLVDSRRIIARQTILATRLSPVYVNQTGTREANVYGTQLEETGQSIIGASIYEAATAIDVAAGVAVCNVSLNETVLAADEVVVDIVAGALSISEIASALDSLDAEVIPAQIVGEPGGGIPPRQLLRRVDGYGYALLPEIECEAVGAVLASGIGEGVVEHVTAKANGTIGIVANSSGVASLRAVGVAVSRQIAQADATFGEVPVASKGIIPASGTGFAKIRSFTAIGRGRCDDDVAAVITFLMAA